MQSPVRRLFEGAAAGLLLSLVLALAAPGAAAHELPPSCPANTTEHNGACVLHIDNPPSGWTDSCFSAWDNLTGTTVYRTDRTCSGGHLDLDSSWASVVTYAGITARDHCNGQVGGTADSDCGGGSGTKEWIWTRADSEPPVPDTTVPATVDVHDHCITSRHPSDYDGGICPEDVTDRPDVCYGDPDGIRRKFQWTTISWIPNCPNILTGKVCQSDAGLTPCDDGNHVVDLGSVRYCLRQQGSGVNLAHCTYRSEDTEFPGSVDDNPDVGQGNGNNNDNNNNSNSGTSSSSGSSGGGGRNWSAYEPSPPFKLEMHTARGPATEGGTTPPTGMGQYKIRALDEETGKQAPVYTVSEALRSTRWALSGSDACGQETISFCRWLAGQSAVRSFLWFDGLLQGRKAALRDRLPDMRMGFTVSSAMETESGLCVIDVSRPEDANDWFISGRFNSLAEANEWQLANIDSEIPQDEAARLVIGFNRDPGDTYADCEP